MKYEDNTNKEYALILGQCTERISKKPQAIKYWEEGNKNQTIGILK